MPPKIGAVPSVLVPARFNGPPASGQGGYSAGTLAAFLDGPAAVSLRRPVPLDEELEVRIERGQADLRGDAERAGGVDHVAARAYDAAGELVIEAIATPALARWDTPPVSLEEARAASARFTPPAEGTFDRCFVCGQARHGDGFHIFLGPVEGTDLLAAPWTPPAWATDADGVVLPEFVWAALDCPGYFAAFGTELAFLARQQSELLRPIHAGVEYVAVGRPLGREGRKGFAATAILDADGAVLAHSEQLLIAPREGMSHK
ncbi:MAG: hypothetical protein JST59_15230 [Actinobacteria bacterium]|nr:hypothetical protein [Actinomycetota bacterium]